METKATWTRPENITGRIVSGLAAVFGNVDSGNDRIHKGAFKKTIAENARRIKHLWQHDYSLPPIAKIISLEEVGRTSLPKWVHDQYADASGGLVVTREYLDTPRGNEILEGIKSGAITEMSFGYDPVKFDFETVEGKGVVRNLKEVKLFDTSDVVWGMNDATVAAKCDLRQMVSEITEPKAANLSMLARSIAGELLVKAADFKDWEKAQGLLTELVNLLTAEPPKPEEVEALTEAMKARLLYYERQINLV